jgi:ParB family chromosome partitioning protein
MNRLVESIREYGVQTPAIARPTKDDKYELISGHRRKTASEMAGLETLPTIIREIGDDAATVLMVDTNMQREKVLPSEKAKAYRMKTEAMERQKGRPAKKVPPVVADSKGKRTTELIGELAGDSHEQVRRYIRLTELIPEILQMVDEGKMAFRPAVEISYLSEEEQHNLLDAIEREQATPSLAQAIKLKELSQSDGLSNDAILSIMKERKPNQAEKISIPREDVARFFRRDATPATINQTIIKALEQYRKREKSRDAR